MLIVGIDIAKRSHEAYILISGSTGKPVYLLRLPPDEQSEILVAEDRGDRLPSLKRDFVGKSDPSGPAVHHE